MSSLAINCVPPYFKNADFSYCLYETDKWVLPLPIADRIHAVCGHIIPKVLIKIIHEYGQDLRKIYEFEKMNRRIAPKALISFLQSDCKVFSSCKVFKHHYPQFFRATPHRKAYWGAMTAPIEEWRRKIDFSEIQSLNVDGSCYTRPTYNEVRKIANKLIDKGSDDGKDMHLYGEGVILSIDPYRKRFTCITRWDFTYDEEERGMGDILDYSTVAIARFTDDYPDYVPPPPKPTVAIPPPPTVAVVPPPPPPRNDSACDYISEAIGCVIS